MKESKFNIYYKSEDGTELIFNSYSCALAIVDDNYMNLVKILPTLDHANVPASLKLTFNDAKDSHFIIDDDSDELIELVTKRKSIKYNTRSLGLTIAPTLLCNFNCIYCYESNKKGVISPNVLNSIVNFVDSQEITDLSVSWYGGEPLLAKKQIFELSDRLIDMCERKGVNYSATMVTNGSLLDLETIAKLEKVKVRNIQVTIDGPQEIHDVRRKDKSGCSSYTKIIDNINYLLQSNIKLGIRINIDKTNAPYLEPLFNDLSKKLVSKDLRISFGQVSAYTDACRSVESDCYDNAQFSAEVRAYQKLIDKYGFREYNPIDYPDPRLCYCCADFLNSFVIDPEGYLYKCWNLVGSKEHSVGNICNKMFNIHNSKNGIWMENEPVYDKKCIDCKLLPICMGGCPYNKIVLKKENNCDLIKYNLKEIVLEMYESNKQN